MAALIAAMPASGAPSAWLRERTSNFHRYDGRFDSQDYGFSVAPPPEATQYVTNGGDANHGPIMILGEHRDIVVYPEYIADEGAPRAQPCPAHLPPREPGRNGRSAPARLGRYRACLTTFEKGGAIERSLQARGDGRAAGIIYTVLLATTPRSAASDFASLRRVAASFRRIPIVP